MNGFHRPALLVDVMLEIKGKQQEDTDAKHGEALGVGGQSLGQARRMGFLVCRQPQRG
jgi:hypothetical protein